MTDVNECARFVGTELGCQNGATCRNLPGSYRCAILIITFSITLINIKRKSHLEHLDLIIDFLTNL